MRWLFAILVGLWAFDVLLAESPKVFPPQTKPTLIGESPAISCISSVNASNDR
jgi:hypothetical protein